MSGGYFNYDQYRIQNIIESLKNIIDKVENPKHYPNDWIPELSDETLREFRRAVQHLEIAYIYAQRIDWLLSGDDSEQYFHKRLFEELLSQ